MDDEQENQWRGLSLPRSPYRDQRCSRCRTPLDQDHLSVIDVRSRWYHPHCAAYLGWVPVDSEAWALALYNAATPPEGGH